MLAGGVVEPAGRLGAPRALSARMVHLAGRSFGTLYLLALLNVPLRSSEPPRNLTIAMLVVWGERLGGARYLRSSP